MRGNKYKFMDEKILKDTSASLLKDMEAIAATMRELIIHLSPHELLGYIYAQYMMKSMADQSIVQVKGQSEGSNDLINENQFLLEYIHAVLASNAAPEDVTFTEPQCTELIELSRQLRAKAMLFAMTSSISSGNNIFGPDTADIEYHAKSTWIMLRGNRYQVLEGEFYRYVLAPHNDVLKKEYGVSAEEIADGFQAMADATRSGHANAIMEMTKQYESAQDFAMKQSKPLEETMETWAADNPERFQAAGQAIDDIFNGGIANVSRHSNLPEALLADLAYQRGEDTEFYAPGDFSGTPYRTLPARKKPLIKLGSDYYAIDPCFARDSGYRALLYNLLQRKPDYKKTFETRQKVMSESAFADILATQLPNAKVFQEVYYKDPISKQWSENDTLILIDDILFLVEAKSGAAATIASPALDFDRHAQSIQDLVIKAYKQCERFFNYLNSAEQVPIYNLLNGKYEECGRIRRSEYRVMVPIGLTVESFSPFSAYCKALPQIKLLLGKHAFISLSIDDLLVLKRFLPTPGLFAHYMEVRQAVAGIRQAHLYDELDHLGAYLNKNRFDQDILQQLKDGKVDMIVWDGMSDIVDKSFEREDWENRSFPKQMFPEEVMKLIGALDATRASGWLSAESHIRDLGEEGRNNLAGLLTKFRQTLNQHQFRYFIMSGDSKPLFVWLQQHNSQIDWAHVNKKASAAALATNASSIIALIAEVSPDGIYHRAQSLAVQIPFERTEDNAEIYEDAFRMVQPKRIMNLNKPKSDPLHAKSQKTGRNERCPCDSGLKYKKCHGR